MNEDINEANLCHLLSRLSNDEIINNFEYSATISIVKELINAINLKVLLINKKSKKNTRPVENNHVSGRENHRR